MPPPIDDRLPNDIYMTLETQLSCAQVNALFSKRGWESRMCSWTEHEITTDFAELVIASESPMLIHGGVDSDPASVDKVLAVLDDAEIAYSFEVYDEYSALLRSKP